MPHCPRIRGGIYNDDRGTGLFLDLAAYCLTTENNVGQYYPDYAYNHPLFTPEYKIYSDSTVSTFISQVSVEDSGLPIFNYSIAYDVGNREPLFCETSPGSIVDISQLQLMLNKAATYGYRNAGFILDRGVFFQREHPVHGSPWL